MANLGMYLSIWKICITTLKKNGNFATFGIFYFFGPHLHFDFNLVAFKKLVLKNI
jgi:hypothetical protein